MMKQNAFLLLLLLFVISSTTAAQPKILFSGYGATGFIFIDQNKLREYNQQVYYEGKLQADIKINKDFEAQLDFRGNSEDQNVILREFSVKYEYFDKIKFKAGNIKIPFGFEQLQNTEDLYTIERSYMHRTISDYGYGGRRISFMAYYNYKKNKPEFPYSYSLSLFKDNSLRSGIAARAAYHFNNDLSTALSYQFQNIGGEEKISSHGVSAEMVYEDKSLFSAIELLYIQDPIEGIRRRLAKESETVFASGIKSVTALPIRIDGKVIESIEPVLLLGFYTPDSKELKYHTFQALAGVNFYFDENVRLRLNGDALFTKNLFNDSYNTIGSKFILEIQVHF